MNKEFLDELHEVAKPVQQWLKDKGFNPHQYVAIDAKEVVFGETTHQAFFGDDNERSHTG